jgi:hypothetical protein
MRRLGSSLRPPNPLIVSLLSWLSLSCGGARGLEPDPEGTGGTGGAPAPVGGAGGALTDAGNTFFVDRPPDLSPDRAPDLAPPPAPDPAPPPDAAPPRDTAPAPDAALLPDPVVPPDAAPEPDAAPLPADTAPAPPPPDTAPPDPGIVEVTSCDQIPCQELFLAAGGCNGDGQACVTQVVSADPPVRTNYCHVNGVKKLSRTTPTELGYQTSMRVNRPDGAHCYTLDMSGTFNGDIETMVWRSPAGAVLLTGSWTRSIDRLIVSCRGVNYLPRIGCPGLDGEPGPTECAPGACPD